MRRVRRRRRDRGLRGGARFGRPIGRAFDDPSGALAGALLGALAVLALVPVGAGAAETVRVRVMAANVTSGNAQSYPLPGPGERIFRALQPDVALVQELNVGDGNDAAALRTWVDQVFGRDYQVAREPGGEQIPNGIVSRWPILESGDWPDREVGNRDFAFARIDLPGDVDLWAVSVHLLTRGPGARDDEARALVAAIREHVPSADYLVIGGDFNTARRNEPAIATLAEVVDILPPYPDDGADPVDEDTNARRRKPFDWVLADGDLQIHAAEVRVDDLVFAAGLVFDSRLFTQQELDDHFHPVLRGDSDAPQMQHMAVVRDFLVPVGEEEREGGGGEQGGGEQGGGEQGGGEQDGGGEGGGGTGSGEDGGDRDGGAGGADRPAAGAAIDLSGWRLEQAHGDAVLVFPPGTRLQPGGLLVVGRAASRDEFEDFWGPLDPAVVYLVGAEIAGQPGFPIVNGGETYRLLDAAGEPTDPMVGQLPPRPLRRGRGAERNATAGAAFDERDDGESTPGRYPGERSASGRVVLTEVSDARRFEVEFVELLFDAGEE